MSQESVRYLSDRLDQAEEYLDTLLTMMRNIGMENYLMNEVKKFLEDGDEL